MKLSLQLSMKFHILWQLLYGCLRVVFTQTIDEFEEEDKHSIDKYKILLNYETRNLVPILRNSPECTCHQIYSLKIKFANVHTMGYTPRDN